MKTIRSELDSLGWLIRTATLAAVAGALYQELRRPPEERTWHGKLLGFVPYDFRLPTPKKLIGAWWNPGSSQVVAETPFGVGWTVNVAAVAGMVEKLRSGGPKRKTRRSSAKSGD